MVLNVRRGLRAFLVLASVRVAAFGCAAPEAFQSKLAGAGAAGTGVGGQAAGGTGGDTNPSGLAGMAGADAGLSGTAGLGEAGTSGVAGATGGNGGSVAGQGGNVGPDGGTAGMPAGGAGSMGGAGAQGGAGGSAGQAGAGGAAGSAGSGTAGTGGGAGMAVVDYCARGRWTETASINAGTAPLGNDGDLVTRYTTGRPMMAGDYYQVDFTGTVYLTAVTLDDSQTSPDDYAVKYDLYSSPNGTTWTKFASGPGAKSSTTISFAKTSMRYVRVQVATPSGNTGLFFSIEEFQVACSL